MIAALGTEPANAWSGGHLRRAGRLVVALVLACVGVAVVAQAARVRALEASAAAAAVRLLLPTRTFVVATPDPAFYWDMGTGHAHGLRITAECSSAFVVGPLMAGFGVLLPLRRLAVRRVLLGVAAGVATVVAVNTSRMVMIAVSMHLWGSDAVFWWSHLVVGSVIAVLGNAFALGLAIRVSFSARHHGPAQPS